MRRWYVVACGIPEAHTEVEPAAVDTYKVLTESPLWRRVTNVNAAAALIVMAFLWGFYH